MRKSDLLIDLAKKFPKGSIWQTRYICLPFVVAVSAAAFASSRLSLWACVGYYALGLLSWTFLEYILHRWVLHYQPRSELGRVILERLHITHHDRPDDQSQVCMPFLLTVPHWALVFGLIVVFGGNHFGALLFTSGLALMMVVYDITHFSTHYMPATNRVLKKLKSHHLKHHFSDAHLRYGVTSPIWDYVFGTAGR